MRLWVPSEEEWSITYLNDRLQKKTERTEKLIYNEQKQEEKEKDINSNKI